MNRDNQKPWIIGALRSRQMTRHEIAEVTGIPLETVCRRVKELIDSGRVEVSRSVLCEESGQYPEVLRVKRKGRKAA